jgi:hypothetical protein
MTTNPVCVSAPPRPRLVLHIGSHKTGTTSIQQALHKARAAMARHGVLYPDTRREPLSLRPKHSSVYHAAARQDDVTKQARERSLLIDEFAASGAHTLLLSAEGLSEPNPRIARFFIEWRSAFDIDIVLFVRRQDLFVESLYSQLVRQPGHRETRTPVEFARLAATRARLDYAAVLQPWHDELGARAVVVDFGSVRSTGLLQSFVRAAGLDIPVLPEVSANRSPDMRLALAVRYLNQSLRDYHLPALANAARQLVAEGRFPALRHVLGSNERRRLLDDLAPANERLAARYGVRFDPNLPEGEGDGPVEDVEAGYLLEILSRVSLRSRSAKPERPVPGA